MLYNKLFVLGTAWVVTVIMPIPLASQAGTASKIMGTSLKATTAVLLVVQPFWSVTVTVYVPTLRLLMSSVVAPVFHK